MGDVLAYEAELLGLVREVGVRLFSPFFHPFFVEMSKGGFRALVFGSRVV